MSERLRPILKWAGGKRSLVPQILGRLPDEIETYYEPFVGGAAVFLALAEQRRFRRAVITDRNPELINLYRVVRDRVGELVTALEKLARKTSEQDYYRIRSLTPKAAVEKAARLVYLNRTGYNGLYRVNSSGGFNVPYGRYKAPRICDAPRLSAASAMLQDVEIEQADFEQMCRLAKPGDAVYLDPPYLPVSKTSSFSAYHSESFGMAEHERLASVFCDLAARGVSALLLYSVTEDTKRLYARFRPRKVAVRRPINSIASKRGAVSEILVTTR